jgi:hypothetical protein
MARATRWLHLFHAKYGSEIRVRLPPAVDPSQPRTVPSLPTLEGASVPVDLMCISLGGRGRKLPHAERAKNAVNLSSVNRCFNLKALF